MKFLFNIIYQCLLIQVIYINMILKVISIMMVVILIQANIKLILLYMIGKMNIMRKIYLYVKLIAFLKNIILLLQKLNVNV